MSQWTEIVELEDKSALSSLLSQPSVVIDIDRSGSITATEMESFLNEVSMITAASEKKDRWLNFSHKIRNKGKEMKPRVFKQSNKTRFKLSSIRLKYEFMFTDGQL
jgi:predicted metal-dependent peptidase